MNLRSLSIVLRPRSTMEIFDLAVAFIRRDFAFYSQLAIFLIGIPALLLGIAVEMRALGTDGFWLLAFTWGVLAQGGFTLAAADRLFSGETTIGSILWQWMRSLPALTSALFLTRFIALLCLATLFLSPRAFTSWLFAHEVALLERQRGLEVWNRCYRLGHAHGATVFAFTILAFVGASSAILFGEVLFNALQSSILQFELTHIRLIDSSISCAAILGYMAFMPLLATARLLLYVHNRAMQDAWDIQLRFLALAQREEENGQ